MFGQAVNIVILAQFNKYRQVWALVIFLQAGFFPLSLFFFSFLSYPFFWASKPSVETDVSKTTLLSQGFFLTLDKVYVKRHSRQEGQRLRTEKSHKKELQSGN